jgi:hypothetical protein
MRFRRVQQIFGKGQENYGRGIFRAFCHTVIGGLHVLNLLRHGCFTSFTSFTSVTSFTRKGRAIEWSKPVATVTALEPLTSHQ